MRIALAGSGRLAAYLFFALRESRHEIAAIIQNGRQTRGWRRRLVPVSARFAGSSLSMTGQAVRHRIPIIWLDRMDERELGPLRATAPDLMLVGGFSIIFKKAVLELPRIGCVNCHSSLLPRHRGPNPFQSVILHNEAESGVTFHVMEEGIDNGAILDQEPFPLADRDTMFRVYHKACDLARDMVVPLMDRIEAEGLHGTQQLEDEATYEKKATMEDAWLDWNLTAEELDRKIRAIAPQPMPRFMYKGSEVRVLRARFDATPVEAVPGTVLAVHPSVEIATGRGRLILEGAFLTRPAPWRFPAPWRRPVPGEIIASGGPEK
jgi:methionyl-tRNA formyltransferase